MKVLLLPPEVLSAAALILSFVARLTDEDGSLSPSARHIPAIVGSLKTKTFVILDYPNEVLQFIIGDTSSSRSDLFVSFGFS